MSDWDLNKVRKVMHSHGARRFYFKELAANDNSKNQVYFGGDFSALNIIPYKEIRTDNESRAKSKTARYKATIDFSWVTKDGLSPAPKSGLILYPDYPEVRFSGFLQNSKNAPSEIMAIRKAKRILLLGITDNGDILGYSAAPDSPLARELSELKDLNKFGVFWEIPFVSAEADKEKLLKQLKKIYRKGWIDSWRLKEGKCVACNSSNCGGYTLEAELGITANGYSEPDYLGWEVKQHGVTAFSKAESAKAVTLITPEPTAGYYKEAGVEAFIRKYGYEDKKGRPDRLNVGGIHKHAQEAITGLTMVLEGYNLRKNIIDDLKGGICLVDKKDKVAAKWNFEELMKHWNRKHAKAVYVPSMCRTDPNRQYSYGNKVRLGEGTDFYKFLEALAKGTVYYDPGIKLENVSSKPKAKRRSQFRIKGNQLKALYDSMSVVDVDE